MTPPDDRDYESKRSASDDDTSGLSPRLREKLGTVTDDSDLDFLNKKPSPVGYILSAVIVLLAAGGIWLMVHNSAVKAKAEAAVAAAEAAKQRAAEVADSLASVARADSIRAAAVADSIAFTKLPKWKQRKILDERAKAAAAANPQAQSAAAATAAPAESTAAPAAPVEQGPFGIDAGQFLDEAQAKTMADALGAKTGLAAQVTTDGEGASATYHIMLGSFPRRSTAEAKASSLLGKGLVEQASVVSLAKP